MSSEHQHKLGSKLYARVICQVAHVASIINQLSNADNHLSAMAFFSFKRVPEMEDMLVLFSLVSLPFSVLNAIYKQHVN